MYLLFDIGGTKMRLAVSKNGKHMERPKIVPTPADFDEGMRVFADIVSSLVAGGNIAMAVGGIAGPLDTRKAKLVNAPHLPGWIGKALKQALEKATGTKKVYLENDAALSGLGEAHFGAGKGAAIVAYLTVSTGIGGARIVDGRIDRSAMGFEPGDQIIHAGKSLEYYVSGSALSLRHHKKPYAIDDIQVWDEAARYLAYGVHNTIVHWSPDRVVVGGSIMLNCISLSKVISYAKQIMGIFPELPEIKKAALGDVSGLYGALALLAQIKKVRK